MYVEDDGGGDEVVEGRGGEEEGDRDDRDEAHRHTTLQLPVPGRRGTNVSWEKDKKMLMPVTENYLSGKSKYSIKRALIMFLGVNRSYFILNGL